MNGKEVKQPYCPTGESFSGLDQNIKPATTSLKPKPNLVQGPNGLQFYEG